MEPALDELRLLEQPREKWNRRLDAGDEVFAKPAPHASDRARSILGPRHELRDHRIVEDRHLETGRGAAVVAHPGSAGRPQLDDAAGRRKKIVVRIFGVNAALDRMAVRRHQSVRIESQPISARNPNLPVYQVDARHHLGNRVLDLQSGVHLEEVVTSVLIHEELDRAGIGIPDAFRHRCRIRQHRAPERRRHRQRGRFLHDFLMAALNRAFAFDERQHRPVRVPEQLHFDVAGAAQASFQIHGGIAECRTRFGSRGAQRSRQLCGIGDGPHPLAAAAGDRLHQQWISDRARQVGKIRNGRVGRDWTLGARDHRYAGALRRCPRRRLAAHDRDGFRRRPDEDQTGVTHGSGERLVFSEESVSRMDGVGAGFSRGVDDAIDAQVAFVRRTRPNRVRLVGVADVQRGAIALGIDGNR